MGLHQPLTIDRIVIDDKTVPGFTATAMRSESRLDGIVFRGTNPGFTRIETHHDGTHPAIKAAHVWRTHVASHPHIETVHQHKQGKVFNFIVFPHDQIIRVTIAQAELMTPGMMHPTNGIWQLIELKRPGHTGTLALPRLLVSLEVRTTPLH